MLDFSSSSAKLSIPRLPANAFSDSVPSAKHCVVRTGTGFALEENMQRCKSSRRVALSSFCNLRFCGCCAGIYLFTASASSLLLFQPRFSISFSLLIAVQTKPHWWSPYVAVFELHNFFESSDCEMRHFRGRAADVLRRFYKYKLCVKTIQQKKTCFAACCRCRQGCHEKALWQHCAQTDQQTSLLRRCRCPQCTRETRRCRSRRTRRSHSFSKQISQNSQAELSASAVLNASKTIAM
jgi:hypothetical protein